MPIEEEVVSSPSVPLYPNERLKCIRRDLLTVVLRQMKVVGHAVRPICLGKLKEENSPGRPLHVD
jgi:hypothetical protein